MAETASPRPIPKRLWLVLATALVLGLVLELWPGFAGSRSYARGDAVTRDQIDNGSMVRILSDLGLVQSELRSDPARGGDVAFALGGGAATTPTPTTRDDLVQQRHSPELTTAAVRLPDVELNDEKVGIWSNWSEVGRDWERPGAVSIATADGAAVDLVGGIRIHGGISRRMDHKSLRVYLRPLYGVRGVASDRLFPGRDVAAVPQAELPSYQMPKLVFHNDLRFGDKRLANPVAYALGTMVDLPAPRCRPMHLVLNGERRANLYVLTEHVNASWVDAWLGHDRHLTLDAREDRRMHRELRTLYGAVVHAPAPLTAAWAEERFDLDNFMRWMALNMFISNYDRFQGLLVRDDRRGGSWFSVLWDLDRGFEGDEYLDDVEKFADRRYCRLHLWRRLVAEDPAFAATFAALVCDLVNHEWSAPALRTLERSLIDGYGPYGFGAEQQIAAHIDYLLDRREGLCRTACELAGTTLAGLEVSGVSAVDGRSVDGTASLWLPHGTEVELTAGGAVVGWSVDGEPRQPSRTVSVVVTGTNSVEALR